MSKPKLQAAIDAAVAAGTLCETGETNKVYFYNQTLLPVADPELAGVEEAELEASESRLGELQEACKVMEALVARISFEPTDNELNTVLGQTLSAVARLEADVGKHAAKAEAFGVMPDLASMRAEIAFWTKHGKQIEATCKSVIGEYCTVAGVDEREAMDQMGCD